MVDKNYVTFIKNPFIDIENKNNFSLNKFVIQILLLKVCHNSR